MIGLETLRTAIAQEINRTAPAHPVNTPLPLDQWLASQHHQHPRHFSATLPGFSSLTLIHPKSADTAHVIGTRGLCLTTPDAPLASVDHERCVLVRVPLTLNGQPRTLSAHLLGGEVYDATDLNCHGSNFEILLRGLSHLIPNDRPLVIAARADTLHDQETDTPVDLVPEIARQLESLIRKRVTPYSVDVPPPHRGFGFDLLAQGDHLTPQFPYGLSTNSENRE